MGVNYNKEMEKIISTLGRKEKPTLLLHSCCAPCSSACLERLKDYFDLTVYYFNPNIDTENEYATRAEEQLRLCAEYGIKCVVERYEPAEFYTAVKGLEDCPEGGDRCSVCYALRLEKTAYKAKAEGYDYFTTTLTLSPLKNAEKLNLIGMAAGEKHGVKFLPSDFKKKGGYLKSLELSRQYGLYRQNYCGCVFSKMKNPEIK